MRRAWKGLWAGAPAHSRAIQEDLLILLGVTIATVGPIVARTLDRFAGMALLVVGGFLLEYPLTASTGKE